MSFRRPSLDRRAQIDAAVTVAQHAAELNLGDRLFVGDRLLLAMQHAVWEWVTMCASILADAQRDHEVAAARRDAAHRAHALRELAAGAITAVSAEYERVTVAVGPATMLHGANASFSEAGEALATARAFGINWIVPSERWGRSRW